MAQSRDILEVDFTNFSKGLSLDDETTPMAPVTFWLPEDYKAKYDLIQTKSKRKFGKLLKEVLKKSIDKIDVEAI